MNRFAFCLLALCAGACTEEFRFDEPDASHDAGVDARPVAFLCTSDDQCIVANLHCELGAGRCVECLENADCTDPSRPACDLPHHACVECETSDSCAPGFACVRDGHRCVKACDTVADCPTGFADCEPETHLCEQCEFRSDCESVVGAPVCDARSSACVECVSNADCVAPQKCDRAMSRCVDCVDSTDCGGTMPFCSPTTHECVAATGS